MTKEVVYCDRCNQEIHYPISRKFSLHRRHFYLIRSDGDQVDLCQKCCTELEHWFNKECAFDNSHVRVRG